MNIRKLKQNWNRKLARYLSKQGIVDMKFNLAKFCNQFFKYLNQNKSQKKKKAEEI